MTELINEITDASDWPTIPLREFERKLRCPICQDFFRATQMLRPCSHNFCSLCIRRALQTNSECPVCRKMVTPNDLEPNRLIDELIISFVIVRPELLAACKASPLSGHDHINHSPVLNNIVDSEMTGRRSSKRIKAKSQQGETTSPFMNEKISDHPGDMDKISDGFSQCPICQKYFVPEKIQIHVDFCLLKSTSKEEGEPSSENQSESTSNSIDAAIKPSITPRKRLTKPVYNLLKDLEIKRLLQEWGLPTTGDREAWVKRHSEFILLYNAECDATQPKSINQLRAEVRSIERAWNRPKLQLDWGQDNDFETNATEYRKRNANQFAELTRQVRRYTSFDPHNSSSLSSKSTKSMDE